MILTSLKRSRFEFGVTLDNTLQARGVTSDNTLQASGIYFLSF